VSFAVRLTPSARRDRDRIVAWYDEPTRSQGDRFLRAFYVAAGQIADKPRLGHVLRRDVRAWHLTIFPYQLWYRIADDIRLVRVIAVVGDKQDQSRFGERLQWPDEPQVDAG
jgi:plasmid stabilization system protein ParE